MNIVVAGASGYIGRALIPLLLENYPDARIYALSRSPLKYTHERITWKSCDLFSLRAIEESLPAKVDKAYYLVQSRLPSAHLDQGSFEDYDLILSDNFARGIKARETDQIVYLGTLLPADGHRPRRDSRFEVEDVLAEHQLPLTIIRVGTILGLGGYTFERVLRDVRRWFFSIAPGWAGLRTTPVDLKSVVEALSAAIASPQHHGQEYDLAGSQPLTYLEMIQRTSKYLGQKNLVFKNPIVGSLSLSREMIARPQFLWPGNYERGSFLDLLRDVPQNIFRGLSPFYYRPKRRTVRSVQRLPLPAAKNAEWVKDEYMRWLPKFSFPLARVFIEGNNIAICFLSRKIEVLTLRISPERSSPERQLIYVVGGLVVDRKHQGRLEFREVLRRRYVIAGIHDLYPRLPWFLYVIAQAPTHLLVMRMFARHLRKQCNLNSRA